MMKPDAVQKGLVGSIISRFSKRGFKLVALKQTISNIETCESHYEEHRGKPFYERITKFIASGPVVCMVWEGDNVIATARVMIGATDSAVAEPATIRGDLSLVKQKNCVHASDGLDAANREIALWFSPKELIDCESHSEAQVYENVPKKVQSEIVPKEVVSEIVTKEVQSEVVTKETVSADVPKEVVSEIDLKEVVSEVVTKEVVSEIIPKEVVSEIVPKEVVSEIVPKVVVSEIVPKEAVFEIVPKKVESEIVLKEAVSEILTKKADFEVETK